MLEAVFFFVCLVTKDKLFIFFVQFFQCIEFNNKKMCKKLIKFIPKKKKTICREIIYFIRAVYWKILLLFIPILRCFHLFQQTHYGINFLKLHVSLKKLKSS